MARPLCALAIACLLAACASRPPGPGAFSFGVMGDTPYSDAEEDKYLAMMRQLDREPLDFIVHIGDFKAGGNSACTDALFDKRKAQFDASAHPFIYTPGDNDWTDCRHKSNGAMDPIERLARLRQVFFSGRQSLGRRRIDTAAQDQCLAPPPEGCGCAAHPENREWTRSGVRFVTLDIPGSNNNVGFDGRSDEEARCRNEANRRWLERAVRAGEADDTRALVVAIQANPWVARKPVYRDFLRQVEESARRLRKPVLLVHGDTHTYRADAPFVDSFGQPLANLKRLETYGSPFVGWVKVTVDPANPDLFSFEPKLFAFVPGN
ncbi:MAG: metallophosphoesterase [Usitatibacter sp.]